MVNTIAWLVLVLLGFSTIYSFDFSFWQNTGLTLMWSMIVVKCLENS